MKKPSISDGTLDSVKEQPEELLSCLYLKRLEARFHLFAQNATWMIRCLVVADML